MVCVCECECTAVICVIKPRSKSTGMTLVSGRSDSIALVVPVFNLGIRPLGTAGISKIRGIFFQQLNQYITGDHHSYNSGSAL